MLRLTKALPTLLLFTCALCVAEARADTFVVTSGSASVGLSGGTFTFSGAGMTLSGGLTNGFFTSLFAPNQATNVLTRNCCGDITSGPGTVNGAAFSKIFYGGLIDLNSAIPPLNWAQGPVTIVVPFTLTGTLRGCTSNSELTGPCSAGLLFDTLLVGQGMATIQLFGIMSPSGTQSFQISNITFNFGDPVPEPATLLLFGTGLAGAAAAARRRRQQGGR